VSHLQRLRVFLSSPGDMTAARAIVRDVVERELQKERAFRDTKLEVVSWDDPDAPVPLDAYFTPQQAIDGGRPRPSDCDVVIVLLWSRMGTPLTHNGKAYVSGTDYEYQDALRSQRKPRLLVYRCTAPAEEAWTNFNFGESPAQKQAQLAILDAFYAGLRSEDDSGASGRRTFREIDDFQRIVKLNLREALSERLEQLRSGPFGDLGIALSYRQKLTNFREEYLVAEQRRVPFGGRDADLDRLDGWLADDARASRMLLTAPAGRGKSALIVQWIEQLQIAGTVGDTRACRQLVRVR
jgi:hypothetical protein